MWRPIEARRSLTSLALLLALAPLPAQALDLYQTWQLGKVNDPTYLAERARYQADQEATAKARALLFPTIKANANATRSNDELITNPGDDNETTIDSSSRSQGYSITLTQPLFDVGAWSGLSQAQALVEQATAELVRTEQSLMQRATEVYFGVLGAQDNLELAEAEYKAVGRQLELAEARLNAGLAAITEVHEARARYELARAGRIEAEAALEDAREAMRVLTGQAPQAVKRLHEEYQATAPRPDDVNAWVALALKGSPQLIAQQAATEAAKKEISRLRAGHYPSLDLVGGQTVTDSDGSLTTPDTPTQTRSNHIGLELNVPLVQGGLVLAQTDEAKLRYVAASQTLEATRRDIERKTRASFLGVRSGVQRIAALKQAVVAGESALEAKIEGFKAGLGTNQQVLDAQRDLFAAKRDYADARYRYITDLLALKQISGTLAEQDIQSINNQMR